MSDRKLSQTKGAWCDWDQIVAESWQQPGVAAPYVRGDLPSYVSPVTGKPVEGRRARREDLARSGCREVEPSEARPVYRNLEFCRRKRLPYMGGDIPPPIGAKEARDLAAMKAEQKAKATPAKAEADAPYVRSDPRKR